MLVCGLIVSVLPCYAESESELEFEVTAKRESKYVSEGRDNLEEGGIFSFETTAEWRQLTFGVSFVTGDSESYDELNLNIEYELELGPLEAYIGYTRLEFLENNESDNEISTGIAFKNIPYLVPALDYTYSTESDGGFLELSLSSEYELIEEKLTLEPYILEGFDFGYASSEYDGPNNLQVGLEFTLALTDQVSAVGSIAHSWAHEDVENEGLGDISWGTIGLSAEF